MKTFVDGQVLDAADLNGNFGAVASAAAAAQASANQALAGQLPAASLDVDFTTATSLTGSEQLAIALGSDTGFGHKTTIAAIVAFVQAQANPGSSSGAGGLAATPSGQFYADKNAHIARAADRLLVGAAADNPAQSNRGAAPTDWLSALMGTTSIGAWPVYGAQSASLARYGSIGVLGASRASDAVSAASLLGYQPSSIGVAAWGVNDETASSTTANAWAIYGEAWRLPGVSYQPTFGMELEAVNLGDDRGGGSNPFQQNVGGGVYGIQLGAGGGQTSGTNAAEAAITFVRNPSRWHTGILISHDSLVGTDGTDSDTGYGRAVALARNQAVEWLGQDGQTRGFIRSTATSAANATRVEMQDAGFVVSDTNGNPLFTVLRGGGAQLGGTLTSGALSAGAVNAGAIYITNELVGNQGIDLGRPEAPGGAPGFLDLHSVATPSGQAPNDHDVRLQAGGGTQGANGQGVLTIAAAGGVGLTGPLTLPGPPTLAGQATTKAYVDAGVAASEQVAHKGQPGGYVGLDSGSSAVIPAAIGIYGNMGAQGLPAGSNVAVGWNYSNGGAEASLYNASTGAAATMVAWQAQSGQSAARVLQAGLTGLISWARSSRPVALQDAELMVGDTTLRCYGGSLRVNNTTTRNRDYAGVLTAVANSTGPAGVLGYTPGIGAVFYPNIDSVAIYGENTGRAPLFTLAGCTFSVAKNSDGTTYTARLLMPAGSPLTAAQLAQLAPQLQILTNHQQPVTAWISTWDPAGTWVQFTDGFFVLGNPNPALGLDPTNMPTQGGAALQVAFGPITKVWAHNANIFLKSGPFTAQQSAGFELGIFQQSGTNHTWLGDFSPNGAYSWGYDSINFGPANGGTAFIARGAWDVGFQSRAGLTAAYMVDGAAHLSGTTIGDGYLSLQTSGYAFAVRPNSPAASPVFSVSAGGAVAGTSGNFSGGLSGAALSTTGTLCVAGGNQAGTATLPALNGSSGLMVGWNQSGGGGEVDLYMGAGAGGGGMSWYPVSNTGAIGAVAMTLTAAGALRTTGGIGAFGATPPASRPSITGSRGGSTASVLAQVLAALSAAGLVADGTTT